MIVDAHHHVWTVARGGQSPFALRTLAHHDECIDLLPGDGPFVGMWLADELAFETVIADDPGSDLFRLHAGNQLALRRISFDEGLRVFEPVGFTEILGSDASVFVFPSPPDGNLTIRLLGAGASRASGQHQQGGHGRRAEPHRSRHPKNVAIRRPAGQIGWVRSGPPLRSDA